MMWRGFGGPGPGFGGFGGFGGCGGWGIAGMILMAVFWVVVIGLIIWAFVIMTGRGHMMHGMYGMHGGDALDIAKERYARGEIDEKEFEKIKKNLS